MNVYKGSRSNSSRDPLISQHTHRFRAAPAGDRGSPDVHSVSGVAVGSGTVPCLVGGEGQQTGRPALQESRAARRRRLVAGQTGAAALARLLAVVVGHVGGQHRAPAVHLSAEGAACLAPVHRLVVPQARLGRERLLAAVAGEASGGRQRPACVHRETPRVSQPVRCGRNSTGT